MKADRSACPVLHGPCCYRLPSSLHGLDALNDVPISLPPQNYDPELFSVQQAYSAPTVYRIMDPSALIDRLTSHSMGKSSRLIWQAGKTAYLFSEKLFFQEL